MTKRIIALLLALILTVGLLPTVALADAGDEETTANPITNPGSQTVNGVTLSKTATKNDAVIKLMKEEFKSIEVVRGGSVGIESISMMER